MLVLFIDRWTPLFTPKDWAVFASFEHLFIFAVNTSLMCFFYLATCWTILARFRARERIKKRHRKIVRRFLIINAFAIVCFTCWAAFLFRCVRYHILTQRCYGDLLPESPGPFLDLGQDRVLGFFWKICCCSFIIILASRFPMDGTMCVPLLTFSYLWAGTTTRSLYQDKAFPVSVGTSLLLVAATQPIIDAVILGNLFQGARCYMVRKIPRWLCISTCNQGQSFPEGGAMTGGPGSLPRLPIASANKLSSVRYLESVMARKGNVVIEGGNENEMLTYSPVAVFVTTFNMGPVRNLAALGGRLEEWIPARGYDVYVIGLQECHCVEEFRAALHQHLGGPGMFHMFNAEIGPATLLYGNIALTVLARASDVASGAFAAVGAEVSRVRNGVNLVVTKAGNKGMTGLSFRYHDATLAFITCHFASDSGGKKRLLERLENARQTLREVKLTDDEGFDVHLQHHHTVGSMIRAYGSG